MTTILIACGVALAATLLVVAVFALGRRSAGSAETKLNAVAAQIDERMQAMVRDLSDALERAQEESRRSRVLGELGGTIDLEEVVTRTLDAAGTMRGVDAVVVTVGAGGEAFTAASGLGHRRAGRRDRRPARRIAAPVDRGRVRLRPGRAGGLVVDPRRPRGPARKPGRAARLRLGVLPLGPRRLRARPGAAELEELALRAGPAIDNARRFREARQLADLDALTGLHNRRYFHETLAREVARAQRYSRSLALVVFDLDDFKAINDRIGHLAGDGVLAEAADRIRDVVRSADVACRVGGDEFAVILPESSLKDADQLYKRLEQAISIRPVAQAGPAASLGRRDRAAPGRRRDLVLRAGRRGALPRQGRRQGNRRRGRGAYAAAATGARNGIQLVSGTAPIVGRRSRMQRISSSARSCLRSAQAA